MIEGIRPYTKYKLLKSIFTGVCFLWALTATILLLKSKPIVIGIDENGARIIRDEKDRLVASEKVNLIKQFIQYFYNYNSSDYREKITAAGELMDQSFWSEKQEEYKKIEEGLTKTSELTQSAWIEDIRVIDDQTYEVDLVLNIQKKLKVTPVKLRTEIKVAKHKRSLDNPSSWEITSYVETIRD